MAHTNTQWGLINSDLIMLVRQKICFETLLLGNHMPVHSSCKQLFVNAVEWALLLIMWLVIMTQNTTARRLDVLFFCRAGPMATLPATSWPICSLEEKGHTSLSYARALCPCIPAWIAQSTNSFPLPQWESGSRQWVGLLILQSYTSSTWTAPPLSAALLSFTTAAFL